MKGFEPHIKEFLVNNHNVAHTLRILSKFLAKNQILKEMRAKNYFEKPSETRQRKIKEANTGRKKNFS